MKRFSERQQFKSLSYIFKCSILNKNITRPNISSANTLCSPVAAHPASHSLSYLTYEMHFQQQKVQNSDILVSKLSPQ